MYPNNILSPNTHKTFKENININNILTQSFNETFIESVDPNNILIQSIKSNKTNEICT